MEKRRALNECLPEGVFNRIHQDIGHASMCWENPENAGIFKAEEAAEISFELCYYIADLLKKKIKNETNYCKKNPNILPCIEHDKLTVLQGDMRPQRKANY